MGIVGTAFRVFWSRILPVMVIASALFIGWLARHELPEGLFFATIIPLTKGKLPPSIFGHGRMVGTIPVPPDLKPSPRPENEMFLELPGGYLMPQNGLGMCCRPTAYDDELVRRTVLWYLLSGGRLIDGAHLYLNHKAIGEGIRNAMSRGIPREEIFVTTKIFPRHFGYNTTKETVPTYLDELGLDYIDLVLMHAPKTLAYMTTECSKLGLTQQECRAETWKGLSELRQEGIVRNVGVSNFAVKHLEDIEALNLAPIAVNQFQYNPWAPDHIVETFEYCQKHNIAVTAYYSLAGAFQYSTAETVETLHDLAAKHNKSVAQIMLRWALQINAAVIPGTGNPKHMRENLDVYSFSLSEEDMSAIDRLRTDESAKKFFYMAPYD
jgi:diketogulonate reductase-like aldo/keto reductase